MTVARFPALEAHSPRVQFAVPSRQTQHSAIYKHSEKVRDGGGAVARPRGACAPPGDHRLSCDGPAGAFVLSAAFTPIFFRNGSTDCLRPRNFSIEPVTSRESP